MAAILKTEKIELKIGSSFTNPNATGFHSVRYDYKAKKRENTKRGTLNVSENNHITIAIPNQDGSRTTETVYQGSAKSDAKACVLIIDPITGEMTLERLTTQIQVKQTRSESQNSQLKVLNDNKRCSRKNNFREAIKRAQQTDKENDQCVPENVAYSVISCPTPDGKLIAKFKKLSTTNDSRVAATNKETKFSADSSTDRKSKEASDYSKSSSHSKRSESKTSKKLNEHSESSTTSSSCTSSKSKKHSSKKSSSNKHHSSSSNYSTSSKHSSSSSHSSSKHASSSNHSSSKHSSTSNHSSKHTTSSNHSSSRSSYTNVSHLSLNASRCIRESNADMRTMVSPISSSNDGFDLLEDLCVSDSD